MKKLGIILLIILATIATVKAQNTFVSGKITDKQNMTLIGAGVILLNAADSAFVKGAITDVNGDFSIQDVNPGKYIIKISFMSYDNLFINKVISS